MSQPTIADITATAADGAEPTTNKESAVHYEKFKFVKDERVQWVDMPCRPKSERAPEDIDSSGTECSDEVVEAVAECISIMYRQSEAFLKSLLARTAQQPICGLARALGALSRIDAENPDALSFMHAQRKLSAEKCEFGSVQAYDFNDENVAALYPVQLIDKYRRSNPKQCKVRLLIIENIACAKGVTSFIPVQRMFVYVTFEADAKPTMNVLGGSGPLGMRGVLPTDVRIVEEAWGYAIKLTSDSDELTAFAVGSAAAQNSNESAEKEETEEAAKEAEETNEEKAAAGGEETASARETHDNPVVEAIAQVVEGTAPTEKVERVKPTNEQLAAAKKINEVFGAGIELCAARRLYERKITMHEQVPVVVDFLRMILAGDLVARLDKCGSKLEPLLVRVPLLRGAAPNMDGVMFATETDLKAQSTTIGTDLHKLSEILNHTQAQCKDLESQIKTLQSQIVGSKKKETADAKRLARIAALENELDGAQIKTIRLAERFGVLDRMYVISENLRESLAKVNPFSQMLVHVFDEGQHQDINANIELTFVADLDYADMRKKYDAVCKLREERAAKAAGDDAEEGGEEAPKSVAREEAEKEEKGEAEKEEKEEAVEKEEEEEEGEETKKEVEKEVEEKEEETKEVVASS